MIWVDLLKKLDEVRSRIRNTENFQKAPRSIVPAEVAEWIAPIANAIVVQEGPTVVQLELDSEGKPIIPADMQDLFSIVPAESSPVANKPSAGVVRRNPVLAGSTAPKKDDAKPKAVMLPRDTPRIEREPNLEDANESTVAK